MDNLLESIKGLTADWGDGHLECSDALIAILGLAAIGAAAYIGKDAIRDIVNKKLNESSTNNIFSDNNSIISNNAD